MQYSPKWTTWMSVTVLIACGAARSAGQTAAQPADHATNAPGQVARLAASGGGTGTNAVSEPPGGAGDARQFRSHKVMPARFFDRSQPVFSATRMAAPAGVGNGSGGLPFAGEHTRNGLASPGADYSSQGPPLLADQTAAPTASFFSLNGKLNFKIFNPLIQTAPKNKNQPLQIEGKSTRAWTTIVGWQPVEPTFPEDRIFEPHFSLLYAGAEPPP